MAIVAADLVLYGCTNHAEDDVSTQGGAIDTSKKLAMVFVPYSEAVEIFSSSASDDYQDILITGRTAAGGSISTEQLTLNGTTVVKGTTIWERILKIQIISTDVSVGTVTVRGEKAGPTIATLEPGIAEVRTLFYDSTAVNTDAPITLYEKGFLKNTHATLSLTSATVTMDDEPRHVSDLLMALAEVVDDAESVATRRTAPTGINTDGFSQLDVVQQVPGGTLAPGEAIGVWLRADFSDGNTALVDKWSVTLSGETLL